MNIRVKDKSKNPAAKRTTILRCPIILPHELLHHMAQTKQMIVSQEDRKQYWDWWARYKPSHPAMQAGIHTPIGLAGDDAKYTLAGAKVIVVCMNSLIWDRNMRENKHLSANDQHPVLDRALQEAFHEWIPCVPRRHAHQPALLARGAEVRNLPWRQDA